MAAVRVRHHVNPLSRQYQAPVQPPQWEQQYPVLPQPLHLDIGCGRGCFLFGMAQTEPDWNFLGLEIREPLVIQANRRRDELGLTNLHFLFCNANTSLRSLLSSLPLGLLRRVSIQFPDPWFKKRHRKRRLIQPELVTTLAEFLVSGGVVWLQSDIEAVAAEMGQCVTAHSAFVQIGCQPWCANSPFRVQTEREQLTLAKGQPVYRALFQRL